jgi:hypothetical protein
MPKNKLVLLQKTRHRRATTRMTKGPNELHPSLILLILPVLPPAVVVITVLPLAVVVIVVLPPVVVVVMATPPAVVVVAPPVKTVWKRNQTRPVLVLV